MFLIRFLIASVVFLGVGHLATAAPGDILFEDDFESGLSLTDWTVSVANNAGTNAYPVTTGNSLYTRFGVVTVDSAVFDLSSVSGANLSMVLEKGTDNQGSLSEDPDADNEDFVLEYLDSDLTTWVQLVYLDAQDEAEEAQTIFDEELPSAALHSGFQFRFRQTGGTGDPYDYWHVDDVELTETSGIVIPPPVLSANSCEYFENGLGNWTSSGAGNSGTSSATASSPNNSMFLNEDTVTVTSDAFDATSVTDLSVWIRKGDDSFSEDPDGDEDLVFEYSNNGVTWTEFDTYEATGGGGMGMGGGGLDDGEIVTPSWTSPTDFTVSSTFQVRFTLLEGDGAGFDFWHVDDVCFEGGMALPTVLKTVVVESDPINGTTNPKAIPGATLLYSITVTNSGDGSSDEDTILISDSLDANATLFVGDLDGSGSPFIFTDGTGSDVSGLVYDFYSLGSSVDSPMFYNAGSTSITPVADYDAAVRSFDIELLGQLYPENIGTPEFTITYRVRLD